MTLLGSGQYFEHALSAYDIPIIYNIKQNEEIAEAARYGNYSETSVYNIFANYLNFRCSNNFKCSNRTYFKEMDILELFLEKVRQFF